MHDEVERTGEGGGGGHGLLESSIGIGQVPGSSLDQNTGYPEKTVFWSLLSPFRRMRSCSSETRHDLLLLSEHTQALDLKGPIHVRVSLASPARRA
jgi:hypothetical protein